MDVAAVESNKRVVITGATGYVGSQLTKRLLEKGWQVSIIARSTSSLALLSQHEQNIDVHHYDGTIDSLAAALQKAKPSVVCHLASLFLAQHTSNQVSSLIESNLLFSTQLVDAMNQHGIRHLVNTGTSWQYFGEEQAAPVNLYAATKQAFESILEFYCDAHNLRVTTLYLFDTYGPNDPRKKLISLLWKTASSQEVLEMSPGDQLVDFVHIDDVLDAFETAIAIVGSQPPGHARYGVTSGTAISLKALVSDFESALGISLPIVWGGRPYREREVMVPWTASTPVPNWKPKKRFIDSVLSTRPNIGTAE